VDSIKQVNITRYKQDIKEEVGDFVISEKPLNIFVNNQYYSTLMCTPMELRELSAGFLFSEGLIKSGGQIKDMEFSSEDIIFVTISEDVKIKNDTRRAIVSGCGRGIVDINIIKEKRLDIIKSSASFNTEDIFKFMKNFNNRSGLFQQTGGVHSCCICGSEGIIEFSEDIGRHNAIDKTIGKCLLNGINMDNKMLFTTGRISSDSVIKTARAGIPVIVSHSGTTDLSIDIAKSLNMTLIGFVRGNRMNIYCDFGRIKSTNKSQP